MIARDWRGLQQELSRRFVARDLANRAREHHLIGSSQPHAVAVAVLEMLTQIRGLPR